MRTLQGIFDIDSNDADFVGRVVGENYIITAQDDDSFSVGPVDEDLPSSLFWYKDPSKSPLQFMHVSTIYLEQDNYNVEIISEDNSRRIDFRNINLHHGKTSLNVALCFPKGSVIKNLRLNTHFLQFENDYTFENCEIVSSEIIVFDNHVNFKNCKIYANDILRRYSSEASDPDVSFKNTKVFKYGEFRKS